MTKQANLEAQNIFKIGTHTFTITESDFSIGSLSHEFTFEIKATLDKPQKAIKEELLNDYNDGEISWYFACLGIHKNSVPTGEFLLEEDKTTDPYFYLRKNGFHYSLAFYGKIIFRDGLMICEGELKNNYYDKPVFLVKICQNINSQNLNWQEYQFSSILETEGIADEVVQFLNLNKYDFSEFPSKILQFKNLKNLTVGNYQDYYSKTYGSLKSIPEDIDQLSKLEGLTIINSAIKTLPESIGKLKNLQTLNVMNCQLENFPESLFSLPKLMYIFADNNQISAIPENVDLPNLTSFSLENNQFRTLPESLATLPKLNSLKIDGNPFERLPTAFNQIKGLQMNIKDKRRLLDFEYRGADGKGLLKWEDSQFFAESDNLLLQPVLEIIKNNKLSNYQTDLLALAKKSVGFTIIGAETYEKNGNTRFGGMPDLPKNLKYPKFKYSYDNTTYKYEFIAQINCKEIANLQDYLPRKGILYFFLSSLHFFGVEDNFKLAQVLYYDGEEELVSGKKLKFKNEDYYEMVGDGCYEGLQVVAGESISLPSFYSYHTNTHIFKNRAENLLNDFETDEKFERSFYDRFDEPVSELYKNDFGINTYVFTQHESPELQAALSQKGEPQDWINLLRVSSRGDFQWGDAGDIAFVIHKSDLLKKNFSNVFCTIESS